MRRRRRHHEPVTTLGGDFDAIATKINEKILDTVALMHPCPVTMGKIGRVCVAPEVWDVLVQAKEFKSTQYYDRSTANVPIGSYGKFMDVELGCMTPKDEYIKLPPDMQVVLETWYAGVLEVYREWMVVRHVANWFNRNASIGAMRYYWPCIMSLLPPGRNLDNMHKGTLEKYKEPVGVSKMLPLCRTTATLVTSGQLLPPRDPDLNASAFKFQIVGHNFCHEDYTGYQHSIEGVPVILNL